MIPLQERGDKQPDEKLPPVGFSPASLSSWRLIQGCYSFISFQLSIETSPLLHLGVQLWITKLLPILGHSCGIPRWQRDGPPVVYVTAPRSPCQTLGQGCREPTPRWSGFCCVWSNKLFESIQAHCLLTGQIYGSLTSQPNSGSSEPGDLVSLCSVI